MRNRNEILHRGLALFMAATMTLTSVDMTAFAAPSSDPQTEQTTDPTTTTDPTQENAATPATGGEQRIR